MKISKQVADALISEKEAEIKLHQRLIKEAKEKIKKYKGMIE